MFEQCNAYSGEDPFTKTRVASCGKFGVTGARTSNLPQFAAYEGVGDSGTKVVHTLLYLPYPCLTATPR